MLNLKDLFHGAILAKIIKSEKYNISLLEWDAEKSPVYTIETDKTDGPKNILIKYDISARKSKQKESLMRWDFVLQYREEKCCYALFCSDSDTINASSQMAICFLTSEEVEALYTEEEEELKKNISLVVQLERGKSFRVKRKEKGIQHTISRNAIEKYF